MGLLSEWKSVLALLQWRAEHQADRLAYTFLRNGESSAAEELSYGQVDAQARVIAGHLQSVCKFGDRVLLMYPPGLEYISAFLGCLYAGVVAVPAYPPRANRNMDRLLSILNDAQVHTALISQDMQNNMDRWRQNTPELNQIRWECIHDFSGEQNVWTVPTVTDDTLAYLQYTSGSTAAPKGVVITHGNLMHNLAHMADGWRYTPESVGVTWMPTFHDLGLMDGLFAPLFAGYHSVLLPPASFLQRPVRWLQAISDYRGTHSSGPNFAYELCARKVNEDQKEGLDLSCWVGALNAAEPNRKETMESFYEAFKDYGFRWKTFSPGFGLAEATLKVCGNFPEDDPVFCTVDSNALAQHRVCVVDEEEPNAQTFVGIGSAQPEFNTRIEIVDPETLICTPAGRVGEIWVSNPSVGHGYWNNEVETQKTFGAYLADTNDGPFLRTGDLGFVHDGELFITGRIKDMIIVRGRNHYPQDIELTAENAHDAIRSSFSAAFSVAGDGEERVMVAVEIERTHMRRLNPEEVFSAIRRAVADAHELQLDGIVLLKTSSLPKTSSGKVQRHACCKGFLNGTLSEVARWTSSRVNGRAPSKDIDLNLFEKPKGKRSQKDVQKWLLGWIQRELGIASHELNVKRSFADYGMDSMKAVELAQDLEDWLGQPLDTTVAWNFPTMEALAVYLVEDVQKDDQVDAEISVLKTDANGLDQAADLLERELMALDHRQ